MPDYFRAIAVDFDGTLTAGDRPSQHVLEAVARTRRDGRRVLLVTGRILAELREVFADVDEWFDSIVAENGAVVSGPRGTRRLAAPVDTRIRRDLARAGHRVRSGEVLLACSADADLDALAAIRRLGLDYQLVYNRSELMILPAGTTKGGGLEEALADLGLSPHSAVGIGDAENDHSLLESCELGIAVANAVDGLKSRADVVLDRPDGEGIIGFMLGPLLRGGQRVHPRRWQVTLGTAPDGATVAIPGSQVNVLIVGASRSGKSFLTGLFVEELIVLGYSVVVVDPEGDHTSLGQLPGVLIVGGTEPLPDIAHLTQLIASRRGSVVIDLSVLTEEAKVAYYSVAPPRLTALRTQCGLPHWLIADEAHEQLGHESPARAVFAPSRKGHCLVTHRPAELCTEASDDLDVLIAMLGGAEDPTDPAVDALVAFTGLERGELAARLAGLGHGMGVLVRREARTTLVPFVPGDRRTSHVRHWHKYVGGELPWHRRFFFRRAPGSTTGATASNLRELHRELQRCEPAVLLHHGGGGDLSRWIDGVLGDHVLAGQFAGIEDELVVSGDAERARLELIGAIEARYLA
jgi:hydroxymethylpyrimidine pyrophosphatase-like HAD family hydrolase